MYISCQEDGDLIQFVQIANQVCPPSLTNMGQMKQCATSDLLRCLQVSQPNHVLPFCDPEVDAELLDGAAVIHVLSPTSNGAKTFADYATSLFVAYIMRRLEKVSGLDVVWDRYVPKRGTKGEEVVADMLQLHARSL